MNTPTMSKEKHSDFGRKLISVLRQVRPYVKHRLYTAETIGIVPRNMYSTSGIIDDAVVKLYENNNGNFEDQNELKLELFKLVSQQIDKLFIREEFHIFTMSTSKVLKKELELMEEEECDTP